MKLSTFTLTVIATGLITAAALANQQVISTNPTAVISLPKTDTAPTVGGGLSIKMPANITDRQAKLLNMAYSIAKKDGHPFPQILQGIIMQETKAGEMRSYKVAGQEFGLATNSRYYGVAQIKLSATQDVLKRFPQLKTEFGIQTSADEEIIAKLIENDKFNLSIASKYLLILKGYGYSTLEQLALAYNQGPGGAKKHSPATHHYPTGVMKHIQSLRS